MTPPAWRRYTFWLARLGWPGLLGLALLAAALALPALVLPQQQAQLARLETVYAYRSHEICLDKWVHIS